MRPSFLLVAVAVAASLCTGLGTNVVPVFADEFDDGEPYLDTIPGPIEAQVTKVRDGDTLEVQAFIWPKQSVQIAVRLKGIDAPEHRGGCPAEREAADRAQHRLRALVGECRVQLTGVSGGKYYGRVLANVSTAASGDLGKQLLTDDLVLRYKGGKRPDWCDGALSDLSHQGSGRQG